VVQLTECYGQPNDVFSFSEGVWSGGSGVDPYPKRCMQVENGTEIEAQVWAKPQPGEAMAVFVVNSLLSSKAFEIDLNKDLNMTGRSYHVRDLWGRQDLPGIVAKTLVVDPVVNHDSRMYLVKPAGFSILV